MNPFIIITPIAFLILFAFVEILRKRFGMQGEYTRKIAHIGSGFLVYFLPYFLSRNEIVVLAVLFTIFLSITRTSGLLSSIHKVNRKTLGEVFFPLGAGISAFFFLPHDLIPFQFGALVLGLSDATGGLVGNFFGKHKIAFVGNKKSWEGTIAFFCTTLILVFIATKARMSIYSSVLVTILITGIELLLSFGLDNLVLPTASAFLFKIFIGV